MNIEQLKQQIRDIEQQIESNKSEILEMDEKGISDIGYYQDLCEGVGELEDELHSLLDELDEYIWGTASGEGNNQ